MEPLGRTPRPPFERQPYPRRAGLVDGVRRPPQRPTFAPRPAVHPEESVVQASVPLPVPQFAPAPEAISPPHTRPRRFRLSKKLVVGLGVAAGAAMLTAAVLAFMAWQASQHTPSALLRDGLNNALASRQLSIATTTAAGTDTANLDLSDPSSPTASSSGTFFLDNQQVGFAGFGSKANTYFSYTKLPAAVKPDLAGSIKNAWVQLRANGSAYPKADPQLLSLSDLSSQMVSPVIVGNLSAKNRQQVVDFLIARQAYKLRSLKPATTTLNGQKVYALPVVIDVGLLKVAMQSAALQAGLNSNDIAVAAQKLDTLKATPVQLYISTDGHRLLRVQADSVTYSYGAYDSASSSNEPQTRLTWPAFAPIQQQIMEQLAPKQPAPSKH